MVQWPLLSSRELSADAQEIIQSKLGTGRVLPRRKKKAIGGRTREVLSHCDDPGTPAICSRSRELSALSVPTTTIGKKERARGRKRERGRDIPHQHCATLRPPIC